MHCLLYVTAFLASAAVVSSDPCPPKPTCGRVDCYNEWVDCFGQLGRPGVPTVGLSSRKELFIPLVFADAGTGCYWLLK